MCERFLCNKCWTPPTSITATFTSSTRVEIHFTPFAAGRRVVAFCRVSNHAIQTLLGCSRHRVVVRVESKFAEVFNWLLCYSVVKCATDSITAKHLKHKSRQCPFFFDLPLTLISHKFWWMQKTLSPQFPFPTHHTGDNQLYLFLVTSRPIYEHHPQQGIIIIIIIIAALCWCPVIQSVYVLYYVAPTKSEREAISAGRAIWCH